ncbi:MAG: hypothetical protein IPL97_12915 [Niastella sp.]|nr:hypothetical protein [Niastella sp.]
MVGVARGGAFPYYVWEGKIRTLIGTPPGVASSEFLEGPRSLMVEALPFPSFRMFDENGWFKEGHGVDPDINVPEDLGAMAKGVDPQLEKAIETVMELIKNKRIYNTQSTGSRNTINIWYLFL